jgi:hypothetical protein
VIEMTEEKVTYIQCLKHTGKKVYKYWFPALAVIGVAIGLGLVISSAWQQINDGFKYIWNGLDFIATIIGSAINQILSAAFIIQWYWWVGIGVIVGPFILVAIYCAWKHFNIKSDHVITAVLIIVSIATLWGIWNFMNLIVNMKSDFGGFIFGAFSLIWWVVIVIVINIDGGYE